LDELRGFCVLKLILFNSIYMFYNAPAWLKHAQNSGGYYFADIGGPLFLFSAGLAYYLSLQKRLRSDGYDKTRNHFVRRSLVLIAFGMIGEWLIHGKIGLYWGTLPMIGLSTLITFPCIFLSNKMRVVTAFGILALWQLILNFAGYESSVIKHDDMGGILATLGWAPVMILALPISEFSKSVKERNAPFFSYLAGLTLVWLGFLAAFMLSVQFVPIRKLIVSSSYILFSLQLSIIALLFFEIKSRLRIAIPLLSTLGKNSLLIYMLSGINSLAIIHYFPAALPFKYVICIAVAHISLLTLLAKYLEHKHLYIKL